MPDATDPIGFGPVRDLQDVQGWDDESLVTLLFRFVNEKDLTRDLIDYLNAQADDENGASGELVLK